MCLWCPMDEPLHGRLLAMKHTADATYKSKSIAHTTDKTKTEFLVGQLTAGPNSSEYVAR